MKAGTKVAIGAGIAGVTLLVVGIVKAVSKPKPPSPPPPGLANLYGKVTDANTGKVVENALVTLGGLQVFTDSNGNYYFLEIAPGSYAIQFSKEGYQTLLM